jgi:hypothetical protein
MQHEDREMNTKNETMRLTIEIPKMYHKKLKSFAAMRGTSMREVIMTSTDFLMNKAAENTYGCMRSHEPNEETIKVIEEARRGEGLIKAKNFKDLLKKLRE